MTSESRVARRREREDFGLPLGRVAVVAVVLVVVAAALVLLLRVGAVVAGALEGVTPDVMVGIGVLAAVASAAAALIGHFRARDGDELPPASPAFRTLADPTRPLAGNAPISGGSDRWIDGRGIDATSTTTNGGR